MDGNFPSIRAAYKDYMWDSLSARVKADTLKQQTEQQQAAARAGKVSGAGPTPPPAAKPAYDSKMGYDQLTQAALKELGG
jgi:hypothetical protein